jgi:hypothetical protein
MENEINIFEMPENTKAEIIDKIEAMTDSIRSDWSDPRSETRRIKVLCQKLRDFDAGGWHTDVYLKRSTK